MKTKPNGTLSVVSCLVGRIAIDGAPLRPLWSEALRADNRICGDEGGRVDIHQIGHVDQISIHKEAERCLLLLGVIHNPPGLRQPLANNVINDTARVFAETPLRQIDGEFVSIQIGYESGRPHGVQITTDKYGFRTVFYCEEQRVLYFSTHISGLRLFPVRPMDKICEESLRHFYHFGVTPGATTLIQGIRKVEAGARLKVGSNAVSTERYFDVLELYRPDIAATNNVDQLAGLIDEAMASSVGSRARAHERAGLALSGGVDSGFVALHLKDKAPGFQSFNLAFGEFYDEHDRIARLETDLGLDVTRINLSIDELLGAFEQSNARASEPVQWNDSALTVLARRAHESGVRILFDGDGADRLFLGMNTHLTYKRLLRWYGLLKRVGLVSASILTSSALPGESCKKLRVLFTNWRDGIPPYTGRKYDNLNGYDASREQAIFELGVDRIWTDFTERTEIRDPIFFFSYHAIRLCPERFFRTPLEQQSLIGLRPASPYWDEGVVSLAISIPTELKLKGSTTKFVLREAAARAGSREYWSLPKVGLQSAYDFARLSPQGRSWTDDRRREVEKSDMHERLKEAEHGREIDLDRLISAWTWYKAWKSG